MSINKKRVVSIAALVIIIVLSATFNKWQTRPVQRPSKVTIGSYEGEYTTLLYIADEKGYLKDENIDLEIKPYQFGILTIPDVISGALDMSLANEFAPVVRSFDSPKLRILASINKTNSYELVARRDKGINAPADLKGKKIGIPKNSESEFFLGTFLTFNNLSRNDIQIVYIDPFDAVSKMTAGVIDATLIWPPHSFNIAKELGGNAVVWPAQNNQDAYFVLMSREDYIKKNGEVIDGMMRALVKAEEFVKSNPLESQNIVMSRTKTDPDYIKYVWPENDFSVSLDQAMIITMEDEARWAIKIKLTDQIKIPNYLNFIYFNALEKVKKDAVTIVH
ncbi:MAG TPA: NrtA/SsuA/CpmA family ABC transporter substrate-binding protein [Candidatus Paceibacterota bacterium]|nr:NrtA/SsuA/CpmA family ABC transporter substrate-binding protein [Candidatus Paceibacterota bacterium]